MCVCVFFFQYKKSPVPREGLPLSRSASHARETEERRRRSQTRPAQRGFQEESRWFHPARPRKLTVRPNRTKNSLTSGPGRDLVPRQRDPCI